MQQLWKNLISMTDISTCFHLSWAYVQRLREVAPLVKLFFNTGWRELKKINKSNPTNYRKYKTDGLSLILTMLLSFDWTNSESILLGLMNIKHFQWSFIIQVFISKPTK